MKIKKITPYTVPISDEQVGGMINDIDWIKKKLESLDNTYSKKWVEKLAMGGVGFILFAVLGALVGLILLRPVLAAALGL